MKRREFNLSLLPAVPAFTLHTQRSTSPFRVDGRRVNGHLTELAQFGQTVEGGTNVLLQTLLKLDATF